jgi:hypothetical protein
MRHIKRNEPRKVTNRSVKGVFYYDIISPFSYFYVKQRHRLEKRVDIEPIPILLGGLLRATDNRGPGEVEAKRPHTYQYCVWLAEKLGLPFRFPEHHPFLTVAAQRLLVQKQASWDLVERAFEYIWIEGKDPNLSWPTTRDTQARYSRGQGSIDSQYRTCKSGWRLRSANTGDQWACILGVRHH